MADAVAATDVPDATELLATWGGWAPAIRDDPFGHFAAARSRCPVQKVRLADGHPAWVVLGYDAARQALNDPRISKDMLAALRDHGDVVAEGLPGPEFSRHMLNVDPPDHTRLRRLVSRAFTPGRVAALEPAIRAIAGGLLDELAAAGPGATVDLIEGYAYPLPFGVIGELLGIPAADRPRLHAWFSGAADRVCRRPAGRGCRGLRRHRDLSSRARRGQAAAAGRGPSQRPGRRRRRHAHHALDIGRGDGTNLGLGHGIHYCLGAPIARLEARVAFEALLGRHPGLLLAADRDALTWTHGDGLVLRGLASLPVVLGPSSIPSKSRRHR
jgi:cytochrome P450